MVEQTAVSGPGTIGGAAAVSGPGTIGGASSQYQVQGTIGGADCSIRSRY